MDLKHYLTIVLLFAATLASGQDDGGSHIFRSNIRTVELFPSGNQTSVPVIQLGGNDHLDLHFDDMDADVKNYTYTLELRNEDWSPTSLSPMEYLKGFSGVQILSYRMSSIAKARYTHYHAVIPDPNYMPTKGGNYLLKVFDGSDPSNPAFQVRMLVVNNNMQVKAQVETPYSSDYYKTHQKVDFTVNTGLYQFVNPVQEVKVAILQDWRWESAKYDLQPTFVRGNILQYNTEQDAVMPGMREWRWLDIRSYRFLEQRLARIEEGPNSINVFVKPEGPRADAPYTYYPDYNGRYTIAATEPINVAYQGDYLRVFFTYVTPDHQPYRGKDLYLYGALTNYEFNDSSKMTWNPQANVYQGSLYLKQGYYDYIYVTRDGDGNVDNSETEGNFTDTENEYLILVYYHPLAGRFDELVGLGRVNSLQTKNP